MRKLLTVSAAFLFAAFVSNVVSAQSLEKKNFTYNEWTKGRFSEAVTVTGPGKMIFLAGIGAEEGDRRPV